MEEKLLKIGKDILKIESKEDMYKDRSEIDEWDSLAHLQLVSTIEDEFGIQIPFEDVLNIKCLGDFLKYMED